VDRAARLTRASAILFPLLLLPLMVVLSRDYGATWDEELQQRRGEQLVQYYTGKLSSLDVPADGAHLYGAPFDVLAVALETVLPWDTYEVRHAVNACVGWLGIVLCGLLAYRLFDPGTALLAMVLLAATPRYFGHSMNNPKDIPFATLSTLVLYLLCRLPDRYPFFTWRSAAGLVLALGLALNVRPGALLFLGYTAILLLYKLPKPLPPGQAFKTAAWLAGITVATLCLGSVFWPWALQRPLVGPILGLAELSRFGWVGTVLFRGQDLSAFELPASYVPTWMAITIPLVIFAGLGLALLFARTGSRSFGGTIALWAAALFPVVYVIGIRAVLYDGIRHLLFVLPPLTILAASGWAAALRWRHGLARGLIAIALVAGLLPPVIFCVREHPNQVVYFNEVAGGPAGAFGRYDMDYWGNCLLQSLQRTTDLTQGSPSRVKVSGWPGQIVRVDARRFPRLQFTDLTDQSHQVEVLLARGTRAEVIDLAERHDLLARVVTRDGALLCAVLPGPALHTLSSGSAQAGTDRRQPLEH